MFFCLEVNWRQTLTPLFAAEGVLAAQILYVLSKKQGNHQFHVDYRGVSILKDHSVTVTPFVCSEGDPLLLSPQRDEGMVLFAGTQEAGASTLSLTTVHESGALLVWRAGVAEI